MVLRWFLAVLILVILFSSISIIGALHRIRDAGERSAALLEQLVDAPTRNDHQPK
ncbi:hypothetical protein V6S67_08850 [Arthrobacter sp. Soc17.1.1.1]|uniref:hypothetical protein n=1 Tax=Arthrobacter sp. Soc17.1.1.1 TaxID=3121277 RepID=UPI002FE4F3C2